METPGPSFTKLFRGTKFVNAIKRHGAANFERQIHVVNGFVKLAPERIDGWMTCKITSFSIHYSIFCFKKCYEKFCQRYSSYTTDCHL